MNTFTFLAVVGGLGAIGSFVLGARAMLRNGALEDQCDGTCWTWRGIFSFCVFMTILAAPLAN
jgi:hypothetical protein